MQNMFSRVNTSFFMQNACLLAPNLLGMQLVCGQCRGIIVETEAYTADDPASHSFRGQTRRNASMYLEGGHSYLYRIYGVHRCLNVVSGRAEDGQAVLLRACEPVNGIPLMWQRRYGHPFPDTEDLIPGNRKFRALCSGPGNLAAAFGLDIASHDGLSLSLDLERAKVTDIVILPGRHVLPEDIVCTTRVGIAENRGADMLRRWYIKDCRFVSKSRKI